MTVFAFLVSEVLGVAVVSQPAIIVLLQSALSHCVTHRTFDIEFSIILKSNVNQISSSQFVGQQIS